MSDSHERFIAELIGGRITKNSGATWADQTDVRNDDDIPFRLAADGKSTLNQSISVTRAAWSKLVEQAHDLYPIMPLRFYDTERLAVGLDLVVISASDFGELLDAVRNT
jgi:hypothetical protein